MANHAVVLPQFQQTGFITNKKKTVLLREAQSSDGVSPTQRTLCTERTECSACLFFCLRLMCGGNREEAEYTVLPVSHVQLLNEQSSDTVRNCGTPSLCTIP